MHTNTFRGHLTRRNSQRSSLDICTSLPSGVSQEVTTWYVVNFNFYGNKYFNFFLARMTLRYSRLQ